jgi:hypothetical protein
VKFDIVDFNENFPERNPVLVKIVEIYLVLCMKTDACFVYLTRPASWSSRQSFLLIMRSRAGFPVLPQGFFLEGEDSHGDHGLGSLVEHRFKAPPGTSYSYITIHLIGTT